MPTQAGIGSGHLDQSFSFSLEVEVADLAYDRVAADLALSGVSVRRDSSPEGESWRLGAGSEAEMAATDASLRRYFGPHLRRCADRVLNTHARGSSRSSPRWR